MNTTMNNEEIKIKIAESLGWRPVTVKRYAGQDNVPGWELNGHLPRGSLERCFIGVAQCFPNYPESLDACAEFEKALTPVEFVKYRWILWDLVKHPQVTEWSRAYLSAAPLQRCLAYLRTKNLIP